MSLIKRFLFHLRKWQQPVMVGNYKRYDGKRLRRTRVSNSTAIQGRNALEIADNVYIGHFNFIDATFGLTIEEGCQITNYVSILTHSSHQSIRLYGAQYGKVGAMHGYGEGTVQIGKYTFIGPHSVIMPNTAIGKGSIVTAYSRVQGEFLDFSIVSGNPAKVIGDTREKDHKLLEKHPELRPYYEAWTQDRPSKRES